ncbi:MAG: hypothetical protein DI606_10535 [Sphingobium sp.]|uniref:hypothetical protein n=1 Tax=Sphingobium sp. TaxID=1912891 RepID=UPI000DB7F635|nr:hypothetical protein [Sphingobium sp.]PZU12109.1 MAG: hypothetical protein DI606_10535 [Sphingobium sp.]
MMLGKMDGKLDSLLTQTATNTAEIKDLSMRVGELEADRKESGVLRDQFRKVVTDVEDLKTARSEAHGGLKSAAWAANAAKFALGALLGIVGALGLQLQAVKKPPVVKTETTIERSISIPKH